MDLEARVQRLEDIEEIRNLVTRYGIAMDERDRAETEQMFTRDATLGSPDGTFAATGAKEIVDFYQARWDVLGPSFHIAHGHTIDIDPDDPDRAEGVVTAHAEVVRNGAAMVAAIIYEDTYRREDGRWKFASRNFGFYYYTPADRYVETMLAPNRNLAGEKPQPADYPKALR